MEIKIFFKDHGDNIGTWIANIIEGHSIKRVVSENKNLLSDARFDEFLEVVNNTCKEIYENEIKRHLKATEDNCTSPYPKPFCN